MPKFFGSQDGLRPARTFTETEALQLTSGRPGEQIGEQTKDLADVLLLIDEHLFEKDGPNHRPEVEQGYPIVFQWDDDTTGHLWKFSLAVLAYLKKKPENRPN